MMLETSRFGTVTVDETDIYTVPTGIPGFPELRRVVLFSAGVDQDPAGTVMASMFWIQDVDNGALSFMSMSPWDAFPDYEIEFDEDELGISSAADVRVLNLVSIHRDEGEARMVANLRAPLVLDEGSKTMTQVILADTTWPIRVPFATLGGRGAN
jgi:flagellar assembly factor FliW